MAASLALDGCAPISNKVDDTEAMEGVPEINSSILMELFEESQGDNSDSEQLDDVIRSLEAEINPIEIDCESSVGDLEYLIGSSVEDEGCSWQVENCDWSGSPDHHSWIDTDAVPSSPCDGMIWYMEDYADEMNCMVELSSVSDYYPPISSMEEVGSYGSLWHETYDQVMLS